MSAMHRLFTIPEMVEAIMSDLDDEDLVSMACASKFLTDIALRVLWRSPVLNGSPLVTMAGLFPQSVTQKLNDATDLTLRVSPADFDRFDYYAKLIRRLNLWHHLLESHICAILAASRPDQWIFPGLVDLHLGASGEQVEAVKSYLTPTLKILRLNHWDLEETLLIQNSEAIKEALISICRLPLLIRLDFTDTKYEECESDDAIVGAFVTLMPQLEDFRSYSFSTVPRIFHALAESSNLHALFLDISNLKPAQTTMSEVITALKDHFLHLEVLGLQCDMEQADHLLSGLDHSLISDLDLRVDGALHLGQLQQLTPRLSSAFCGLRSLRCTSSSILDDDTIPNARFEEALHPLMTLSQLTILTMSLTFRGEHVLRDEEFLEYFRAWPFLRICALESDPSDDSVPDDDESTDYGLSLNALLSARRYCPKLEDLVLSYVNTSNIPAVDSSLSPSSAVFNLHLPRSHVHNHTEVQDFVHSLWSRATIRLDGCSHFEAVTMRHSE